MAEEGVINPTAEDLLGTKPTEQKVERVTGSKNIHTGIAYVVSTFNNTIVTITDMNGNVISWSTGGKEGFRGSRKSTAVRSA